MTTAQQNPTKGFTPKVFTPKVEDFKLKMLIYGEPGVGKSSLAATSNGDPAMKNTLVYSLEKGELALTDASVLGCPVPDVVRHEDFRTLEQTVWWLRQGGHGYNTFVLDTLNSMANLAMDEILAGKRNAGGNQGEFVIFQEDWGTLLKMMRKFLNAIRDLDMHVIFTCHDKDAQIDGLTKTAPSLSPGVRDVTLALVDVIGLMKTKTEKDKATGETVVKRALLTSPNPNWIAKDRSPGGKIGGIMHEPSMPKIMDKILGRVP